MKAPWLTKKSIAAATAGVLADYEAKIKRRVQPPIPVENIIERGLSLKLGFTDLRKELKLDDVLGATYVKEGMICVDRSLAENQNEGRLCFTFATRPDTGCCTGNILIRPSGRAQMMPLSFAGLKMLNCRLNGSRIILRPAC